AYWLVIPGVFALWANLHGSFIVGLGLLATICAGRAIDLLLRLKSLRAVGVDPVVRRLFVLLQVSAVAALISPHGIGLYAEVLSVAGHPNLRDLIEWEPLTLRMSQGKAFAACVLALIFVYRFSPRRVRSAEVLLLVGLGMAALWSSRMIVWWAPVAAFYLGLHSAALIRTWRRAGPAASPRSGKWSVVTVGLAWIFFAITPFGVTVLHGKPQDPEARMRRLARSTSSQTPLDIVQYLNEHPRAGLIFNTFDWGDFLLWAGPRDVQVFVASHAHLIPEEVWQDYLSILHAASGWEKKLDRYGVQRVILDKRDRDALAEALRSIPDHWRIDYENNRSVVFVRNAPE
ncbi:MAG: hypothetical protein KF861_23335, partial [Planctomycetaceae bacterium]|nr:hypothetical protein [Planctomycetaceae bacterium]